MSEDRLADFLNTGKDWARLMTSVPGVFVLKLPVYKRSPSRLAVELNPVNEVGSPTKRRGFILRTMTELEGLKDVFQYDKLSKLLGMLNSVNPEVKAGVGRKGEEVIEL